MIPKAEVLAVATAEGLLATTVEKDYVLGWMLFAIAQHPELSRWSFKGGTCLKKCYFDTYRFSEDLDFTIPHGEAYDRESLLGSLRSIAGWVREQSGVDVPLDGIEVEESANRRGEKTFAARATFVGPLQLARDQRQRIRFDLTQDEVIVDAPILRTVFHGYSDAVDPIPTVTCYSLSEILAEKVRALFERSGRARDVFDIVNVGRNMRAEFSVELIRRIAGEKFASKTLDPPSTAMIMARVDPAVLANDWANSLRHQLPVLPPVEAFRTALQEVLGWLLEGVSTEPVLAQVSRSASETMVPPVRFPSPLAQRTLGVGARARFAAPPPGALGASMDRIRFAARNRLLASAEYQGVTRLVEPYSLRVPGTGNLLLYVFEVQRGGSPSGSIKAFKVAELGNVQVTERPFQARYLVEL